MGFLSGFFNKVFKLVGIDLEPELKQANSVQGVDFTAPATDASIPVIYGSVQRTGGTIIYRATNDVDSDDTKNDLLHLIIVWGESNGALVKTLYIDDEPITSSKFDAKDGGRWAHASHYDGTVCDRTYLNGSGWIPHFNHPEGLLYSYVRLEKGAKDPLFGARPNVTADIVQPSIYDVRRQRNSNSSSNPALQLYDYLTNDYYGKGLDKSDLDIVSFKRAATMCDLQVQSHEGGRMIPLYTSNVRLDTGKSIKANCEMLLAAMRASLPVVNGKLTLVIDTDKAPVAWQANAQTIVSDIDVHDASKKDRFNQVTVQYYDVERNGKLQDAVFPEKNSDIEGQWRAEDNGIKLNKKIKIETLNNFYEAKRLAEFIARKSREQLSIKFTARDDAALLAIGDIVRVSDQALGFDQKPFVLTDMVLTGNGEVDLSMVEHQPSQYSWLPSKSQPIIPDSTYNSRKPTPPTGLQASIGQDNKLTVQWQSALSDFEYKVIRDNKVVKAGDTTLNQVELALAIGEYTLEVFAVNALGYRSNAATLLFTVVVPVAPTVEITSVTPTSAVLYATTQGAGIHTNYEWQFAGEGEQKTVISQVLTVSSLKPNTAYQGRVRTLSAAGKSDWHSFTVSTREQTTYERNVALVFELSQTPSWVGIGIGWQPSQMVNQVRVSLRDLAAQTELAFQTLQVTLSDDGLLFAELAQAQENLTDSALNIEFVGQSTSNLVITASHELQVVRQAFSVTGLSVQELQDVQQRLEEMDELADSVLKQALSAEQVFDSDLQSTLYLEQKTDTTNATISEAVAAQANENEAITTKISTVQSEVDDSKAQIIDVSQTLVDTEQAIATKISTVQSEVEDNKAQIVDVSKTLANTEEAISTKISTVQSEVDNSKAQIVTVSQTLANTEEAISSKVSQLTSTVNDNHAEIKTYYITKADSQSAVSQAKTELQSQVSNNLAYLNQTFYTAADADAAIATSRQLLEANIDGVERAANERIEHVEADLVGNSQSISSLIWRANNADGSIGALASNITQVKNTAEGNSTAINTVTLKANNLETGLSAVTGRVSAVETKASGTATAVEGLTARVTSNENKYASANLTLTSHTNKLGSLEARAEIGVDVNGHVTGMTITDNKMRVKAGVFELLDNSNNSAVYFDTSTGKYTFNGQINASSGYFKGKVEASSGYFKGKVEASSGTFKGRVEASSGSFTGHINATSGSFSGSIYATRGTINSATLRSCKWDAGGGSTVSASSGMLAIRQGEVLNVRFLASGEGFLRNLHVWDNNRGANVWGIAIKYHDNGIHVDASSWALYAKNGEIGPHTSAHETLLPIELNPEPGDILCDDELMHIANISNAICTAKFSSSPMDITVRGVYTRRRTLTDSQPAGLVGFEEWEQLAYLYDVASINAGGEGAMNVCGEGGNLQTGDLICSSSMLGKGMRQPTQSEERYTIAQVRHNVTFDSPDQVKQVAVIYKRG
ncbi:hypothetical protein PSECIP111951_01142 [Pseudoalteromonas holothuriae]|uniref:Fibronectin type-III domain-containing protein n=1 Tax=Pseudoalteromonas holothuriae TaxID=2963714 RepID=A0ABN8UIN6_9GAMM|nr:hypothetical protein [Pseudoalteromonas sp. CIP111951]CAH9054946.1 hypothetical protein PSECIP111951_01142 [Pseudoalteromonas sp. CIP111951]